ncbi:MAG TPA: DNA polymerase III subunit alpha [Bacteroidales bacterium]|nr:DNA polymerase III subunit alpha [Bacteroidales bacterium]
MAEFTHLHVHTQYSILDGAAKVDDLLDTAQSFGMDSLAITDHGNMFGVLDFFKKAKARSIKPLIGCEIYVAEGSRFEKQPRRDKISYHLILLARNRTGYHNLARLSTRGYLEGFYYTPRIDKEILREHSEGLIACSACLGGEIPYTLMNKGRERAEEVLKEYLDIFGGDFYLELQRHGLAEQDQVNPQLLEMGEKYGVKCIAANDVHFVRKEDYEAHKILICLNTGKDLADADGLHYTGNEYLRSPEEMAALFADIPEVLANTREIVDKVEDYDITTKDVLLPDFPLPEGFDSQDEYLKHLTYEGAARFYPDLNDKVQERLDFELSVIAKMGFAGYFLIVADFINKAREMDVMVGPGRGSAAGSAVAYCTGITSIDPIRYNLLFERFLNPERISMPDIDVDFDDEGRDKVLKYVVNKYGEARVAQIVTFGTMAARLAIRDVARVLKLPLPDADRLAKLVPEVPGVTLKQAYREVPELAQVLRDGPELERRTLQFAQTLEGSARQTGTHACGVIIGREDLIHQVPLSTAKDSELMITQYEGKIVEDAGLLKMDFLGLKTLSIMKDAILNVKKRHGLSVDIENISLDDEKTFQLYQRGDTIGTFQFESEGMRQYLKDLKPNTIEDLIAMNALYRPGPMEYIPMFIRRKQGMEKVIYPHPDLEDILRPTYGIMVYQEQIMQTAQILAGYNLGQADVLRRAMGKKKMDVMEKEREKFVEGADGKGISKEKAEEVFGIMQEFAKYGFNRSHSAAYSIVAYRTGYLKANYPAEYMAAVLTHNLSDIKKITQFIEECRHQQIDVLGPDINESQLDFTVNEQGQVRFGMGAIKGVGENAVREIVREREANGPFRNIFDLAKRIPLRTVNRKSLESLAMAGAFDGFVPSHRAQYFHKEENDDTIFLDRVVRYGQTWQERLNASQVSLFGAAESVAMDDPVLPECRPWSRIEQLKNEKEVTGFYISGHPLDEYRTEIGYLANTDLNTLKHQLNRYVNKDVSFAGMVTEASSKVAKNGNPFGTFVLEDFSDSMTFTLFAEEYLKMKHFLEEGTFLMVRARVQPSFRNQSQLNIRITSLSLLPEALDKQASKLTLKLALDQLDAQVLETIVSAVKKEKGSCRLVIHVFRDKNLSVDLPARKAQVNPTGFIKRVGSLPGVNISVN